MMHGLANFGCNNAVQFSATPVNVTPSGSLNKYGLPCDYFHETHKFSNALLRDLYQI